MAADDDKASNRRVAPRAPTATTAAKRKRFSFIRFFILLFVCLSIFGGAVGYWGYKQFERDLPDRWSELTDYKPARTSRVFSAEGELIGEFYLQKRVVLPPSMIPKHVQQAFVAAEDNRFFDHHGIDPLGIARAAFANLKAGRVVQGGSTITQQVAKLMLVGNERNLFRKIREAILAHKIERRLSKEQILAIYMNHIYLGHGAYGVQVAAETYFAKDAKDLSIAEAAMLGGLPKAPTEDSPFSSFKRARDRQRYVLGQMLENELITLGEYDTAMKEPIAIISKDTPLNHLAAPYFVEYVRRIVQAKYSGKDLYDRGLRIHTTLVMPQQRAAELAVRHGLDDIDRRFGFRGPVAKLAEADHAAFLDGMPRPYAGPKEAALGTTAGALVLDRPYLALYEPKVGQKGHAYARLGALRVILDDGDAQMIEHWLQKRGNRLEASDLIPVRIEKNDVAHGAGKSRYVEEVQVARLAQQPDIQAALIAADPATGYLTAMVGGYDYSLSQFNRATQAKRQVGSSIKPYIYATALEHGFTEVSVLPDAPISVPTAAGFWSPHNYKGEYLGPITLRTALQHSVNTVCVRLVVALGVDKVIEGIRRFGITASIVRHPSIALGTPEVPLMEHVYGYATFPAGGLEVTPIVITKILDADGNTIEEHKPPAPKARRRRIPADTAYVMVDMMKNVIEHGTGQKAKELGRPTAGKTGTSNDFKDNWFMAYTHDLVAGVWVGRDDFKSIGYNATGGTTAAPIWTEFMKAGHPPTPPRDFDAPPDIYFVRATGDKGLPARPGTPNSIMLPFRRGTLPPQFTKVARAPGSNSTFGDDVF